MDCDRDKDKEQAHIPFLESVFRLLFVITAKPALFERKSRKKKVRVKIFSVHLLQYWLLTVNTSLLFCPAPAPQPKSWDFILLKTYKFNGSK